MEDKRITPQELKAALYGDVDRLVEQVAEVMNSAQPGNIIDNSEELVRDASAEFRKRLYQKALELLQDKYLQEDFSPSPQRTESGVKEQRSSRSFRFMTRTSRTSTRWAPAGITRFWGVGCVGKRSRFTLVEPG